MSNHRLFLPFLLVLPFLISCQPRIFHAVSSNFAKEFCSCHFVEKQTKPYCETYSRQFLPISSYQVRENTITATGFNRTSVAKFVSIEKGCLLTTHPKA